MTPTEIRRVHCPTCGVRRYNHCRSGDKRVDWCHADRLSLAELDNRKGRPRRPLPLAELTDHLQAGASFSEACRRVGVPRCTLHRRGITLATLQPPSTGGPTGSGVSHGT